MMRNGVTFAFLFSVLFFTAVMARATDYKLVLKDHKFTPHELVVPANQKIKVTIQNEDATPAEFESTELNREKLVAPNSSVTIFLGPLDPGKYEFLDDYHHDTTTGIITTK